MDGLKVGLNSIRLNVSLFSVNCFVLVEFPLVCYVSSTGIKSVLKPPKIFTSILSCYVDRMLWSFGYCRLCL